MNKTLYRTYLTILENELIPATGCTEPIAIAYAAAKGRSVLDDEPDKIDIFCSGNIIKNVKGVVVPNSGGLRGVEVAAVLGALGGDASRALEVLQGITEPIRQKAARLLKTDYCACHLAKDVPNLYILAALTKDEHSVKVEIRDFHTNITRIEKDGETLFRKTEGEKPASRQGPDKSLLDVEDILRFAEEVSLEDVKDVLDRQIEMNRAISEEGMKHPYGAEVGRMMLKFYGDDVKVRAVAKAAAGSDARMGGCPLPVVINSGSGNQGMTVSLPVIEYAEELRVPKEKLYRALVVSNLVAIHQKYYIGSLSAFCGAVSAASGCGAGIAYLCGGSLDDISRTIVNTIATVGGMVCDGAKASCAAKIASAVNAAVMAHCMSVEKKCFQPGEGLVKEDVEKTIQSIGQVGRVGMRETDTEILNIMISKD